MRRNENFNHINFEFGYSTKFIYSINVEFILAKCFEETFLKTKLNFFSPSDFHYRILKVKSQINISYSIQVITHFYTQGPRLYALPLTSLILIMIVIFHFGGNAPP